MKEHLKDFFKDASNLFSFLLALIPSTLLYVFSPHMPIPYGVFVIAVFVAISCLWFAFKRQLDLSAAKSSPRFKVRIICDDIILCEPDGVLVNGSLLMLCLQTNGIEKPMALGYVETINQHGYAQVALINPSPDILNKLNVCDYSRLVIKPTITLDTLQQYKEVLL